MTAISYHGAATNRYELIELVRVDLGIRNGLAGIEIIIIRIDQFDDIISILQWLSIWGINRILFLGIQMINIRDFYEGSFEEFFNPLDRL